MTSDGVNTFAWDVRNQLSSIAGPGLAASFAYDARGMRTGRTVRGASQNFFCDGWNVVQELAGTTPTANLLTGLGIDETFTRTDSGGTVNLITDGLRSTLALLDGTGTAVTQYTYDPFGGTTATGTANRSSSQFTGRENDGTGLYYYRARYYHPAMLSLFLYQ